MLRQIENLQTSHGSQVELLENAERSLIERLKDVQSQLCEVNERFRQSQESLIDQSQLCKTYEMQLQSLKMEKSKLNAEYQLAKTNLDAHENERYEREAQHKVFTQSLAQQVEQLQRDKKQLEAQIEIERTKTEQDAKKFQTLLSEYNREKDAQLKQQQQMLLKQQLTSSSTNSSTTDSPSEKTTTTTTTATGQFPSPIRYSSSLLLERTNSADFSSFLNQSSGAINVLEGLQSRVKQKDGEIVQLQKEIANLERTRESMAKEMVNLSDKLDKTREQLKEFPSLQENYTKLNVQYNALLQLCGEKTEEVEELRLDLQDVKEMYKLQIEDLIKRSNI